MLGQMKFSALNLFDSKKIVAHKKFLSQKRTSGPKKYCVGNNLDPKIFWVKKNCGSGKHFCVLRKFWV